jgi:type I restriction enzyme R subunit
MSELLDALIKERKQGVIEYRAYLDKIRKLAQQVIDPSSVTSTTYPPAIKTQGQRAIFDNLGCDEDLVKKIDQTIRQTKKAQWIGNFFKEKEMVMAVREALDDEHCTGLDNLMDLIKQQDEYR